MTPEQKAAYVNAMAVVALVEALGMVAENQNAALRKEAPRYLGYEFEALIDKHALHHNSLITLFNGA